jgi:hypothetical protein
MVLAVLVLVPFFHTPFTIDDPIYLREAQHALIDPLHPQAFNMVWSTDLDLRVSQIVPGGIVVPYLLIPVALSGCKEWMGHFTQLLLVMAALVATSLAALRMGMDRWQSSAAAILVAACPAVLGMAGTLMPDIPAMTFTILGMERILAWRDNRRWHQAAGAIFWLTLAALTRANAIMILPTAFILLLDGVGIKRFLPVVITPIAFVLVSILTADPDSQRENVLLALLRSPKWHLVAQNSCAFLVHFALLIPLTVPWLLMRAGRMPSILPQIALVCAALLSLRMGWVAFAAGATVLVLADILWQAMQRRDRMQLALWLWLLVAFPVVFYIHLPSKYLLPSVPAAALLVARLIPVPQRSRWVVPSIAVAGVMLGAVILWGIRDLAQTQQRAVTELIEPHLRAGERAWFAGHWGFQWYAEQAGATPVTLQPPLPQPGDIVVVSQIDFPRFARSATAHKVLESLCYSSGAVGRVMDFDDRVGFFSSPYGYLPWKWGSGKASCFEVWRAE